MHMRIEKYVVCVWKPPAAGLACVCFQNVCALAERYEDRLLISLDVFRVFRLFVLFQ